jgi:hypothetical protein
MNDYERDLEYELELMRECGPALVPRGAARLLDDLAHGMASGEMRPDEARRKRAHLSSLAQEMRDLPELLEAFKWAFFYLRMRRIRPTKRDDGSTDEEATLYGNRYGDAKVSILRVECGFLEPYLTIQLSELRALLEQHGVPA